VGTRRVGWVVVAVALAIPIAAIVALGGDGSVRNGLIAAHGEGDE
jgi:hypothetical protein